MNIDWNNAPEWANYLAQDRGGAWYWYAVKPTPGYRMWVWQSYTAFDRAPDFVTTVDWRESLVRRPDRTRRPQPGKPDWSTTPEWWEKSLQQRPVSDGVWVDEIVETRTEIPLVTNWREETLERAKKAVLSDRNRDYGDPEDNFRDIADLWNAYLGDRLSTVLSPSDVGILNILQKIARHKVSPKHEDHMVDVCGYAACTAEINLK